MNSHEGFYSTLRERTSKTTVTIDSHACSTSEINTIANTLAAKNVDQRVLAAQEGDFAAVFNNHVQTPTSFNCGAEVTPRSVTDADIGVPHAQYNCEEDNDASAAQSCSYATSQDSEISYSHYKSPIQVSQSQYGKNDRSISTTHTTNKSNLSPKVNVTEHLPDKTDVIVIGAGFAGLYMLHDLRKKGYITKVLEAGDGIGGTWYWNRYPGARCDIESMQYSYSFSDELQQEWQWSERYATQSEILRYLDHVADKFDLRKDIQLGTRVTSVIFNEDLSRWVIETSRGDRMSAKFCVMATGCLSVPKDPDIKGLDQFKGNVYSTSKWPKDDVSFVGRRVAVIGTGASGVQCIPIIAKQADHLDVFQRTPNFVIPLDTRPMDTEYEKDWKSNYYQRRSKMLNTDAGILIDYGNYSSFENMTDEERYEAAWKEGGIAFLAQFKDQFKNRSTHEVVSDFIRSKIREVVQDPTVAEALVPYNHVFGARRPCMNVQYYETFNRDNVVLVDIRNKSINEILPTGIKVEEEIYEVDDIVLAIGFDAITGAMRGIDIRGRSGRTLREAWIDGPRAFLGMVMADFPNLFMITGPGSPAELSNMVLHIEQNAEWITKCVEYAEKNNIDTIEPIVEVQNAWMDHVSVIGKQSLYASANSWYNGANIPGKMKIIMPYAGGFQNYLKYCEQVALDGYENYLWMKRSSSRTAATSNSSSSAVTNSQD